MRKIEDNMVVRIGGTDEHVVQDYRVKIGLFEIGQMSATISDATSIKSLLRTYAPGTPYDVLLNGIRIHAGELVSISRSGDSTVSITGRDLLHRLAKSEVKKEYAFKEYSYQRLAKIALEEAGLPDTPVYTSNAASIVAAVGDVLREELTIEDKGVSGLSPSERTIQTSLKIQVGSSWLQILKEQFVRSGVYMWADPNTAANLGALVLSTPTVNQAPSYLLIRQPDAFYSNILGDSYSNDISGRHTEYRVYGRSAGGKFGIGKIDGRVIDDEMVAFLNPLESDRADGGRVKQIKTTRDRSVTNIYQAECLALRQMSEARRNGLSLSYSVADHSTEGLASGAPAIWFPDTVADVSDDELDIHGGVYIAAVEYIGAQNMTHTNLTMWRTEDIWVMPDRPRPTNKASGAGMNAVRIKGIRNLPTISPIIQPGQSAVEDAALNESGQANELIGSNPYVPSIYIRE